MKKTKNNGNEAKVSSQPVKHCNNFVTIKLYNYKKEQIMKTIFIFLTVAAALLASNTDLDKTAYRAYKKGQYKKAFELYKKSGTLKSVYNLAQFYDKGIGTPKNPKKAKEYFNRVYRNINFNSRKTCENELLPYFYKTLKKLNRYGKYNKLKTMCSVSKDPFIANCPSASIIPKNERKSMNRFACRFYKKFPHAMKKLLHIHSKILSQDNLFQPQLINRYKSSITASIRPVINYYINKGTHCINRAYSNADVANCSADYKTFLQNAFLSQTLCANRGAADKAALQKAEQEAIQHEQYLNQAATLEAKAKAIRELKEMHKHVKRFIIVG